MIQAREHAPLASAPWKANPSKVYAEGRMCPDCGLPLAQLNPGPRCWPCQKAKETREFKAAHERAAASEAEREAKRVPKRGAKPQERKVMEVDGVTLKPVEWIPGRQGHGAKDWAGVIATFLRSGETACEVSVPGMKAQGIYSGLHQLLKKSHEAFPSVRKGVCYLVRIQK